VEEIKVPEVCLLEFMNGISRWTLQALSFIVRRPYLGNHASEGLPTFIQYFYLV
jgi:hypothetical protein